MTDITRRTALVAAAAMAVFAANGAYAADGLPQLKPKASYKVGFAQTESDNPWRIAQTESMKATAKRLGHELIYTDAGAPPRNRSPT